MCEEQKYKKEYVYSNDTGDAHITVYNVFQGVEVAYISAHMDVLDFSKIEENYGHHYVCIHFCREGRIEQEAENEFFYLMPDDCSVTIQNKQEKIFRLPLKHYHGISIGIDTEQALSKFTSYIGNESLDPKKIAKRLCGEEYSVILRSVESLKHIFSESYEISEAFRVDYLKIKLLELLFLLSQIKCPEDFHETYAVPRVKAELVKKAAEYIDHNLNCKVSLKDLTNRFGVSDTYLQKAFREVYGMPVASFIRMQKMQKAAQELIHTDRSIDAIAEDFGYMNESKFSAVFKKMIGDSPSVFRKEHSKIKIL